jgi:hypothetical protein
MAHEQEGQQVGVDSSKPLLLYYLAFPNGGRRSTIIHVGPTQTFRRTVESANEPIFAGLSSI